jgi:phosphopantothenoylcysteine decarboxylase/phosphopantothenate--cysteine ligase
MQILITAGGTREYIDPVRFISNASSGKMGYALARAALSRPQSHTNNRADHTTPAQCGKGRQSRNNDANVRGGEEALRPM